MKVSNKIIGLILIIFSLTIAYTYIRIVDKKYVLSNIKAAKIDSIEIFHNNDSFSYNIDNPKCNDILKYIKNITKGGQFHNIDDSILFDDFFLQKTSIEKPNNYFVKVNFTSNTEINLNNTCITCKYMIIDINEKTLYYWIQASSSIKKLTIENVNLNDLEKQCQNK